MSFDLQFYWGLLLRRLPVMLALFLVCAISATVAALKLPATFHTSALLLVEEPQIPDTMVANVVQVEASEQLQVIEQRLLTRVNMLDIARKFDVFEDIRSMSPDDVVRLMREDSQIRRMGGQNDQATLMRVGFTGRSPTIVANVVNEYVNLILQESSNFRMSRAEGTLNFFEQEVERLSDDLDLQSGRIVSFKNQNANALPSDLTYRQNRQTLLEERQARLERDIVSLQKQRNDMVAVYEATGRISGMDPVPRSPEEEQLIRLRADLEQARAIYSESNPRMTLLRNRIAQLEKTLKEKEGGEENQVLMIDPETGTSRSATLLDVTLADFDQRIQSHMEELDSVSTELEALEVSIQATAGNAVILNALERDFDNIQARYNEAVRNLNRARVNERIEVTAQGERISVIEGANVPQEPSGPKRLQFVLVGVAAGLGLAGGFFILLEILNRCIRRPFELQSKYGIVPLAVVPYMESGRERIIRRSLLIGALLAVAIGVPAALYYIDTNYMALDIIANKVFDRLGLT
jgi:uncharacterized protein involved in exopolysaccharide biosynthesis